MEKVERWGLTALALGVALRLIAPAFMDLGYDANAYAAMAHGFAREGELILAWGDVLTFHPTPPGHSHHFPPAYPVYLGLVYKAFGYGLAQAKVAAVVVSLAALAVCYLCARDLYGRVPAAVVGGLLALDPHLVWITGVGFSENLALAFFALTMWGIVRSLGSPPFIVVAGLFAGLAYLTRSSMGAFFLIAGVGGAAWRLKHRGWRGLADPWYALGAILFLALVGAWAWRNFALFGDWQTSPGTAGIPRWIGDHKLGFVLSTLARAPVLAFVLAPFLVFLWPEARASLRRWRDEHASALWLAVVLTFVLGLIFSAAYLSMGVPLDAMRLDNMRYVVLAVAPLAWALAREADWSSRDLQRRLFALGVALLLLCGAVFAFPAQYAPAQAARSLEPALREGDRIAVDGTGKYPFYAYLERPHDVQVFALPWAQGEPEFIVTTTPGGRAGYVLLQERRIDMLPPFGYQYAGILARADVAAERGLSTLEPLHSGW